MSLHTALGLPKSPVFKVFKVCWTMSKLRVVCLKYVLFFHNIFRFQQMSPTWLPDKTKSNVTAEDTKLASFSWTTHYNPTSSSTLQNGIKFLTVLYKEINVCFEKEKVVDVGSRSIKQLTALQWPTVFALVWATSIEDYSLQKYRSHNTASAFAAVQLKRVCVTEITT